MRTSLSAFLVAGIFLVNSGARAPCEEGPSLARLVPEDVHFHGNFKATPEARRLMAPYARAARDLARSGIGKEFLDLATQEMPPEKREEVLSNVRKVLDLLRTPKWGQLVREEASLSYRFSFPLPEYIALFRVPEAAAPERLGELRRLFEGIAEMTRGNLKVFDGTLEGASILRLQPEGAPIGLIAAAKKGIVALATSETILRSSLLLMDSQDGKGSLASSGRFSEAFRDLSAPGSGLAFFDLPGFARFLRGIVDMAAATAGDNPDAAGAISIVRTILDEVGRIGPIASTSRAQADGVSSETKIPLAQKDGPGFLEKLLRDQEPVPVARIVPKDARGFFMTAGVNPVTVHDAIVALIRERIPSAPAVLDRWDRIQEKIGFNLREDLLSWIDGGCAAIQLPRGQSGTCGCVLVLRLEDEAKAREKLMTAYEKAKAFLESRGQTIELAEVPELGDSFRELRIGAFSRCHPVIGIPGKALIIASSTDALKRVAATFRGEAPGFDESPAFAALGFTKDPVYTAYYQDIRESFRDLADLTAGAGFVLSLLPREKDTRPLLTLGSILTKLGTFLRAIDLGVDRGGWDVYDSEKHEIRSHQAGRIKAPALEF